jgi:hypothetical protein
MDIALRKRRDQSSMSPFAAISRWKYPNRPCYSFMSKACCKGTSAKGGIDASFGRGSGYVKAPPVVVTEDNPMAEDS